MVSTMRTLSFNEIQAMLGNGSSMRTVLKYFIDKGATVYLLHETLIKPIERYFLVEYEELRIPLRAYNLNFYSLYNSLLAQTITTDKLNSYAMLKAWGILTPETLLYGDHDQAAAFVEQHAGCVVKPRSGAHGDGITVNLHNTEQLQPAIQLAQVIHPEVLLQQQVAGDDYRLLFIDYKFVAAVKRLPASITGDGTQSIRQLVETSNTSISGLWANIRQGAAHADARRGSISKTPIAEIVAARGEAFLERVPATGKTVQLLDKANVSLGGQTIDITEQVNGELIEKLSALLRSIALPFCGIDVLSTNITGAPDQNESYVIELNAAPGLRLHELPTEGQPRPVCAMMAESLISYYRNLTN